MVDLLPIKVGARPNDGTGDANRLAWMKANANEAALAEGLADLAAVVAGLVANTGAGAGIPLVASGAIPAGRFVAAYGEGQAVLVAPAQGTAAAGQAIGYVATSASAGGRVDVRQTGLVRVTGADWRAGDPVYVTDAGTPTTARRTTGWVQQVGVAVGADLFLLTIAGSADLAALAQTLGTKAAASDLQALAQALGSKVSRGDLGAAAFSTIDAMLGTADGTAPAIFKRASDRVRLLMFGWTGNNENRTLGDAYQTLDAARVMFPAAQSLAEYVDGCALERVIQVNAQYFGRSMIKLPASGTRVSRTIDTTGIEVYIEGCGPSAMIIGMGPGPIFRHGIGARLATPSDPQNRPFRLSNLRLDQEGPVPGSSALDISYSDDAGIWYATKILDCDFRGFQYPIRMRNPGRGFQMQRCGFYGPDGTTMPNAAVTIVTDSYARHGSAQFTGIANKFANYRWGVEIDMQPPFAAYGKTAAESRRSLEDVALMFNTAQNGWGWLKVNCNQAEFGYSSLLWTLLNNDWQGAGHGIWMRNCNKIEVKGGFWIGNQPKPKGDEADPFNGGDRDPLTGLPERRFMSFYLCEDLDIEGCRLDVPGDYDAACLIHVDGGRNVNLDKMKVRAGNPSLNAGFRLIGVDENTIREMDTEWTIWGSSTNNRVVDINGNQVSQTNVLPYGTVDRTGEYSLRGLTGVRTIPSDAASGYRIRVDYPRRPPVPGLNAGQGVPFFLGGIIGDSFSPYPVVNARAAGYVPQPTLTASDTFGFEVTFPNTMGGQQVQLEYQARGR